jgi:hypothetical protein
MFAAKTARSGVVVAPRLAAPPASQQRARTACARPAVAVASPRKGRTSTPSSSSSSAASTVARAVSAPTTASSSKAVSGASLAQITPEVAKDLYRDMFLGREFEVRSLVKRRAVLSRHLSPKEEERKKASEREARRRG